MKNRVLLVVLIGVFFVAGMISIGCVLFSGCDNNGKCKWTWDGENPNTLENLKNGLCLQTDKCTIFDAEKGANFLTTGKKGKCDC